MKVTKYNDKKFQQLCRLLWEGGTSPHKIGKIVGASPKTVVDALKTIGLVEGERVNSRKKPSVVRIKKCATCMEMRPIPANREDCVECLAWHAEEERAQKLRNKPHKRKCKCGEVFETVDDFRYCEPCRAEISRKDRQRIL